MCSILAWFNNLPELWISIGVTLATRSYAPSMKHTQAPPLAEFRDTALTKFENGTKLENGVLHNGHAA